MGGVCRSHFDLDSASAETIARMYNLGLAANPDRHDLTGEIVWNAFYVHALLGDCALDGRTLTLPHRCLQSERFAAAPAAPNYSIANE